MSGLPADVFAGKPLRRADGEPMRERDGSLRSIDARSWRDWTTIECGDLEQGFLLYMGWAATSGGAFVSGGEWSPQPTARALTTYVPYMAIPGFAMA